jgi:hypothetical protein
MRWHGWLLRPVFVRTHGRVVLLLLLLLLLVAAAEL